MKLIRIGNQDITSLLNVFPDICKMMNSKLYCVKGNPFNQGTWKFLVYVVAYHPEVVYNLPETAYNIFPAPVCKEIS